MARMTFGNRGGRVRVSTVKTPNRPVRSVEEVVRELKTARDPGAEDYRERSLALHGLVCAHCGREFDPAHRHLLTVHHKDGNHQNNPPDGSNWENLCVYCHEDTHSRGLLGDYLEGSSAAAPPREETVVYRDQEQEEGGTGLGSLGEKLRQAMEKKKPSR
jgi:cytochrome c553